MLRPVSDDDAARVRRRGTRGHGRRVRYGPGDSE
jgi:hypothetical protein